MSAWYIQNLCWCSILFNHVYLINYFPITIPKIKWTYNCVVFGVLYTDEWPWFIVTFHLSTDRCPFLSSWSIWNKCHTLLFFYETQSKTYILCVIRPSQSHINQQTKFGTLVSIVSYVCYCDIILKMDDFIAWNQELVKSSCLNPMQMRHCDKTVHLCIEYPPPISFTTVQSTEKINISVLFIGVLLSEPWILDRTELFQMRPRPSNWVMRC